MKKVLPFVLFLICATATFAQQIAPVVFKPVTGAEFNKHLPLLTMTSPTSEPMGKDGLISINTKVKTYSFKNNGTGQIYINIGDFVNMPFSAVRSMTRKKDRYYMINKNTGVIDTLFSLPIFYPDRKKFATIGGIDLAAGKQLIQIGEVVGNHFKVTKTLKPTTKVSMTYLFWLNPTTFYISDRNVKYYKVELK